MSTFVCYIFECLCSTCSFFHVSMQYVGEIQNETNGLTIQCPRNVSANQGSPFAKATLAQLWRQLRYYYTYPLHMTHMYIRTLGTTWKEREKLLTKNITGTLYGRARAGYQILCILFFCLFVCRHPLSCTSCVYSECALHGLVCCRLKCVERCRLNRLMARDFVGMNCVNASVKPTRVSFFVRLVGWYIFIWIHNSRTQNDWAERSTPKTTHSLRVG